MKIFNLGKHERLFTSDLAFLQFVQSMKDAAHEEGFLLLVHNDQVIGSLVSNQIAEISARQIAADNSGSNAAWNVEPSQVGPATAPEAVPPAAPPDTASGTLHENPHGESPIDPKA